jgi:hypothetical protein
VVNQRLCVFLVSGDVKILIFLPRKESQICSNQNVSLERHTSNLEQDEQVPNSNLQVSRDRNLEPTTPSEPKQIGRGNGESWYARDLHQTKRRQPPYKDPRTQKSIHALQTTLSKLAPTAGAELPDIFSPTFHPIPAVLAGMKHVGASQSQTMPVLDIRSMPLESKNYVWGLKEGCNYLLGDVDNGLAAIHAEVFLEASDELLPRLLVSCQNKKMN